MFGIDPSLFRTRINSWNAGDGSLSSPPRGPLENCPRAPMLYTYMYREESGGIAKMKASCSVTPRLVGSVVMRHPAGGQHHLLLSVNSSLPRQATRHRDFFSALPVFVVAIIMSVTAACCLLLKCKWRVFLRCSWWKNQRQQTTTCKWNSDNIYSYI